MKLPVLAFCALLALAVPLAAYALPLEPDASQTEVPGAEGKEFTNEILKEIPPHKFAQVLNEEKILESEDGQYFIGDLLTKIRETIEKAEKKVKQFEKVFS